jgi:hypothetical protein
MSIAIRDTLKIDSSADANALGSPGISQELVSFIEQAPVAIALFDCNMRYLAASLQWEAGFGRAGASLTGLFHYEAFPQTPATWREVHQRVLAGEEVACEKDPVPGPMGEPIACAGL